MSSTDVKVTAPDIVFKFAEETGICNRRIAWFKRDCASAWADGHMCAKMIRHYFPSIIDDIPITAKSSLKERVQNWESIQLALNRLEFPITEVEVQAYARRE